MVQETAKEIIELEPENEYREIRAKYRHALGNFYGERDQLPYLAALTRRMIQLIEASDHPLKDQLLEMHTRDLSLYEKVIEEMDAHRGKMRAKTMCVLPGL